MVLGGLLGLVVAPESAMAAHRKQASQHADSHGAKHPGKAPAKQVSGENAKPRNTRSRLDAVIDISHQTNVRDFSLARQKSNIIGVIHKATEGGDWKDPMYARRRAEAEAAGMLWGAYHFGTRQYSGDDQAELFLKVAKPGPNTLIALDFEQNDGNPGNSMRLRQAEDFVKAIHAATGRFPLIYTNQAWADGKPVGDAARSLGATVTERSVLALCPLWLADYRSEPQVPKAWKGRGWHFWQYAGDTDNGGPRGHRVRGVWGIETCDRNIFRGDASDLQRFWKAGTV
jgi:lysozyme